LHCASDSNKSVSLDYVLSSACYNKSDIEDEYPFSFYHT